MKKTKSLLGPEKREKGADHPLDNILLAPNDAVAKRIMGEDVGFHCSALFLPISDYATQSSGLPTLCGIHSTFTLTQIPVYMKVNFALLFYSSNPKDVFEMFFSAADKPDVPILTHTFEIENPGVRWNFFEVADAKVVSGGIHFFEGRLNGKTFQRYPVKISAMSVK